MTSAARPLTKRCILLSCLLMVSLKKLMVWPLCLLLGFSLYLSGSCEVLCFGDSGHVEIETVHLHSCCASELSTSVPTTNYPDHECAGCSDVPLGSTQLWHRSRATDGPIMAYIAMPQAISSDFQCSITEDLSAYVGAFASSKRAVIRIETATTVLRC